MKPVKQEKTAMPLTASHAPATGSAANDWTRDRPVRVQVREQGQFFRLTREEANHLLVSLQGALKKALLEGYRT